MEVKVPRFSLISRLGKRKIMRDALIFFKYQSLKSLHGLRLHSLSTQKLFLLHIPSQPWQYHHLCSFYYFFHTETLGYSTPQAYITSRRDGELFIQRLRSLKPHHHRCSRRCSIWITHLKRTRPKPCLATEVGHETCAFSWRSSLTSLETITQIGREGLNVLC